MSDINLTFASSSPVNLTFATTDINLSFNCFEPISWLDSLPEYNSDADATTAGKTWYVTGAAHESLPYGVLKKALT